MLPKTRRYSEMVTKSYIKFRDTDLVGGQGLGVLTRGRTVGVGLGVVGGAVG